MNKLMNCKYLLTALIWFTYNTSFIYCQIYSKEDLICIANSCHFINYANDDLYIVTQIIPLANGNSNRKSFFVDTEGKKSTALNNYFDVKNYPFYSGLSPVKDPESTLYGYINPSGKLVIPYQFDEASKFENGYAALSKDKKYGVIDSLNNTIIPFTYDHIENASKGPFPVRIGEQWGLIDKQNNIVTPIVYDKILKPTRGLYPAFIDERWGVINELGNVIIPFDYREMKTPFNGYFPVRGRSGWTILNNEGEVINLTKFNALYSRYGMLITRGNDQVTIYDKELNPIITSENFKGTIYFPTYFNFHNNLLYNHLDKDPEKFASELGYPDKILFSDHRAKRLVSHDGKVLIEAGYRTLDINKYTIIAQKSDSILLLDHSGNLLQKEEYDDIKSFGPGKLFIKAKKDYHYKILNHKGENVFNQTFLAVKEITEGLLLAKTKDGWSYFSVFDGSKQLEKSYSYATPFRDGTAIVGDKYKMNLINRDGITTSNTYREIIYDFNYYKVRSGNRWGLIDDNGNDILETDYSKIITLDHLNKFIVKKNGQYGLFDGKKFLLAVEYDKLYNIPNRSKLLVIAKDEKEGLVNEFGKIIHPPEFDKIERFKCGVLKIVNNQKYGLYFPETNNFILPEYEDIVETEDCKLFKAKINNKWGVINNEGKFEMESKYDEIEHFNRFGIAFIKENNQWSVVNKEGDIIANFDDIKSDGYYKIIVKDSLYGLFEATGKLLIEPKFQSLKESRSGFVAELDGKFGIITKNGDIIMNLQYDKIIGSVGIYENYFDVYKGRKIILQKIEGKYIKYIRHDWHIYSKAESDFVQAISNKGKIIGEDKNFTDIARTLYSNHIFNYSTSAGTGIIDTNGNVLVEALYDDIHILSSTNKAKPKYFKIMKERIDESGTTKKRYGLLDSLGQEIIPPIYSDLAGYISEGLLSVSDDSNKCGYMTHKGVLSIDFKYDMCDSFKDGHAIVRNGLGQNYRRGIIDKNGTEILPVLYRSIHKQKPDVYKVSYRRKTFFVNLDGECLGNCPEEYILKELGLVAR